MLIFVLAAVFMGYFAVRIFLKVLPVLLIAAPLWFLIYRFHIY